MADSIHLSICNERADAAKESQILTPWAGSIDDLAELFSKAVVGDKMGPYFVRGPFSIPQRSDENILRADVLVIDGDKSIDPENGKFVEFVDHHTGEIKKAGAPAPHIAHDALEELGLPHVIYTSHSHDPDRQHPRWRAVIPCPILNHSELLAMADYVVSEMNRVGCYVANATENGTWAQAWFLPRKRSADAAFDLFDGTDTDPITRETVEAITKAWEAENSESRPRERQSDGRTSSDDPSTPIGRFNAAFGNPEAIISLLEKHGYVFVGHDRMNDQTAYRLIRPGSESGRAGVHLYPGYRNGKWLTYCQHAGDPLDKREQDGSQIALDAFEVFAILKHGGDKDKAVAAVAEYFREEEKAKKRVKYRLLTPSELSELPPIQWRVKGLIPANGMVSVYGPSGSGKSFLVLELTAAIARGLADWFGHRVKQSPVIYCALEGESGIKHRVQAYCMANECELPDHFRFVLQPFDLTDSDDRQALIEAIQAEGLENPVIVLDTLSRATPGIDENSSKDMGQVVEGADIIKRSLNGLVLLVHHTGKDEGRGARGHSSFKADLDGLIAVSVDDAGQRSWTASKVKDGELGSGHLFDLEQVDLFIDDDGDEVSSCVIRRVEAQSGKAGDKLPSLANTDAGAALTQLLKALDEFGTNPPEGSIPSDKGEPAMVVMLDQWKQRFLDYEKVAASKDSNRVAWNRALENLKLHRVFDGYADFVWLTVEHASEQAQSHISMHSILENQPRKAA